MAAGDSQAFSTKKRCQESKIMFGFKEAAYWWNKTLTKVFLDHHGYKRISKDQCELNLRDH